MSQEDTVIVSPEIEKDTTASKHSPKLATIFSAVVPGLGQAYNKKYWKLPILYGGAGTLIYLYGTNNKEYKKFLDAYLLFKADDSLTYTPVNINGEMIDLNKDVVIQYKDKYRKSRDLCVIGMGFLYILNIVDASVDAHFFNFDVSEDLSMRIEPVIMNYQYAGNNYGFKINFYF